MRVAHDRRRSRHPSDALTVEDLLSGHVLDLEPADSEPLPEPARATRDYLPPPRSRRATTAPAREPESRLSKIAKLAGLTAAAGLLVGAVVASSMVTRERPGVRSSPTPPRITGAAALAGFVPAPEDGTPEVNDRAGTGGQPAAQGSATASPTSERVSQAAESAAPTSENAAPDSSAPQELTDSQRIKTVRQFYQRMGSNHPQDALRMLAPGLAGDEPGDLVRAWSSMKDIHVESIEAQPDGTVRAVATMRQQDDTELRVTQVLSLAGGPDGIISQAVLLSADQL